MIKGGQANIGIFCLILGLLTIAPGFAKGFSCQDLLDFQNEFVGKLPMQIDGFASLLELNVNCDSKTIEYVKRLKVDETQLASGFRSRKQKQYQELQCNEQGVARHGWTSIDKIFDKHNRPLVALVVKPEICQQDHTTRFFAD